VAGEAVVMENSCAAVISYADDDQEPQTQGSINCISTVVQGGWHAAANRWLLSGMQRYLNVPLEHVTARR
jgi:hypothetical protein